jgi:hypothetical protein
MKLLLSRYASHKSKLLFTLVDTDTKKTNNLDISYDRIVGAYGMVYSGDHFCAVLTNESGNTFILAVHMGTGKKTLLRLNITKFGKDIVSVFPGQFYLASEGTDSLNNISVSPVSFRLIRESVHFNLAKTMEGKLGFNSLSNHKNRWYATTHNAVLELSNYRVIYSDVNDPKSLFFNSYSRLCFIEGESGVLHLGNEVVYMGYSVYSIIEDVSRRGYWVAAGNGLLKLIFVDYAGNISNNTISIGLYPVFGMVESRDWVNEFRGKD